MKKLVYILSILFPLVAFADVLPEPFENNNEEIEIINEETDVTNSEIEESDVKEYTDTIDENIVEEHTDEISNDNVESTNEDEVIQADLVDVYFGFCNDGVDTLTETLNAAVMQGEPFPICLLLYNSDKEKTAYIDINLVYGTLAGDGSPACDVRGMNEFISSGNMGLVEIPADNYLIKEIEVTFPLGYEGEQRACVTISSVDQTPQEEIGGLVILERRTYHTSFFVGAADGIKNELTVNELATKFDDNNDLILSFFVENTGDMENTFDVQGIVKGLLGYNKKFEILSGQVAPKRSQYVEANLGLLPSYGGKFDIEFTINGTPYFSYDITNANVDPTWLEPKSWSFSTSVFKMPWLILAIVIIFIILLIVLFKKPKQKVVYVQQQPQQPIQPQQVQQQPTQQYTQPVQQPIQQPQEPVQPVQQPQPPQNPDYTQN